MANIKVWPLLGLAVALGCPASEPEQDVFTTKVVPVLERRCADANNCHGVLKGTESQYSLDADRWLTYSTGPGGELADPAAALRSTKAKINSRDGAPLSSFLRKTLPVAQGGLHHFGGPVFPSRDVDELKTLEDFASSVTDGGEGLDVPDLSELEVRFRSDVLPILIEKGCATATCHGELNFGVSIFKGPIDVETKLISRADVRESYRNAKANITLWGEPLRSRLIAKMLPFEVGGIPHKGGNDAFFAASVEAGQDPRESDDVQAILGWIAAERAAVLGPAPAGATSIIAVGGPIPAADPFVLPPFTPGSDLYRIDAPFSGVAPVNLTAAAHSTPADIRDPAVSHDGLRVVFSMRTSADNAFNIYTIGVDGTGLRQLTQDTTPSASGRPVANLSPIFGPSGGAAAAERIYFVSMRGDLSDDARYQNSDLYAMDVDGANLERLTYTCQPEVRPTFLESGEFAGSIAYTIKRSSDGGYKGVFFRFPVDHNAQFHFQPEAHPHFGMSEPPQVFYALRELPDGRNLATLVDDGNLSRGGPLSLLERQFAVEIPDGEETSSTLPGFRHALTVLTSSAARTGTSAGGFWRDPSPMPDGSILVAHAEGPVDLTNPPASVVTRLMRVRVGADRASFRPVIESMELLAGGELAWTQPVAVYPRGAEDPPHPRAWTSDGGTGRLVHSGVKVIEAVLARMSPTGPRALRDDIQYVRPLVPVASLADLLGTPLTVTAVPPEETLDRHPHATNLSISGRMPLFAAIEIPPAPDGSLAADIPAKVPVRVTTLDAERMVVGAQQHQWYAVLPGERFPVGIPPESFSARCAGCHGAMDGRKESVLQPAVDVVTQASVTAGLYVDSDRRRPIDPLPAVTPEAFVLVDFRANVQPIVESKCLSCHSGATPAGGLTLTSEPTTHYTRAYESLLRPGAGSPGGYEYVDAAGGLARASYLVEKLRDRELEAPRALTQKCPPAGAEQLTAEEILTFTRWIEFGAAYVGKP
ncbi:MAG: hypothetical protein HY791_30085 [Deltaproteobacteria bacterium]|nr:hypothetical protein [Deltaproteobacteria bacterium]